MKPSIGRTVHYANSAKGCLAAIITGVHFGGAEGEHVSLHIFGLNGDSWGKSVCFHDEDKVRNTWHWPERVDDKPTDPAREPGTVTGCACTDGNQAPEDTEAVYDEGVAKLRETRAQGGPVGPVVITSQPDPVEAYKAVTAQIKDAVRRQGGHSAA